MRLFFASLFAVVALGAWAAEPGTATPPPTSAAQPAATPPPPGNPPPGNPHPNMGPPHGMPPGFNFNMPPKEPLKPQDVKDCFYAIGQSVGKGVGDAFMPSKEEWAELKKGLQDQIAAKELRVKPEDIQLKARQLEGDRREVKHQADLKKNEAALAKLAKEPGMEKLPSGVLIKHLTPGTGAKPGPTDTVSVNYKGTLTDGTEFDSSYKRNKPAEFPLNGVIKCWTDGVGAMKVGEKAKIVCPSDLAYGPRSPPGSNIPANAILTFEVELLAIKPPAAPPPMMGAPPGMPHMPTPPPPAPAPAHP